MSSGLEQIQSNDSRKKRPAVGFHTMDPVRLREIASVGGKIAQMQGKGHRFTKETARAAALKGLEMRQKALRDHIARQAEK